MIEGGTKPTFAMSCHLTGGLPCAKLGILGPSSLPQLPSLDSSAGIALSSSAISMHSATALMNNSHCQVGTSSESLASVLIQ